MIRGAVAYAGGTAHIRTGKDNEDAYCVIPLDEHLWIAAAGDGVGSAAHAQEASTVAVDAVCQFLCEKLLTDPTARDPARMKDLLETAYAHALTAIRAQAERDRRPLSEYETTLMTVIYDGRRCFYANAGDGGIVALRSRDGTYTELTVRQRTDDGCVIPLSAGRSSWQIGESEEELSCVCMATDGMMDRFRLPLGQGFYVPLMMLFADPHTVRFLQRAGVRHSQLAENPRSVSRQLVCRAICHALRRYGMRRATVRHIVDTVRGGALFDALERVTDDKTVVSLFCTGAAVRAREPGYYAEPDWAGIRAARQAILYPTLGRDVEGEADAPTASAPDVGNGATQDSRPLASALKRLLRIRKRHG